MSLRTCWVALLLAASTSVCASADSLSPYSDFQGLTNAELATVQCKLTYVGSRTRSPLTCVIVSGNNAPQLAVFKPFYRSGFIYASDFAQPRTLGASTAELSAVLDDIATLPDVTDGGIDSGGGYSFALSVTKSGVTHVFESIVSQPNGKALFQELPAAFSADGPATAFLLEAACSRGMTPGTPPADVSSQVQIKLGGFRKDRATGQYLSQVRVTNSSAATIGGPLIFVYRTVDTIVPVSPTGTTCVLWPSGATYQDLRVGSGLAVGAHVDYTLRFDNPENLPIVLHYQRVFSGSGAH